MERYNSVFGHFSRSGCSFEITIFWNNLFFCSGSKNFSFEDFFFCLDRLITLLSSDLEWNSQLPKIVRKKWKTIIWLNWSQNEKRNTSFSGFHFWDAKSFIDANWFSIKNSASRTQTYYCRFSYAGTWELVNLFIGTKNSYHICYENIGRKHNKILWSQETDMTDHGGTDTTEQYASKEECIKWNK